MQAKANKIALKPQKQPKRKGVIDIAYKIHIIQELACSERRKGSLSGILAKFDGKVSLHGQWTTIIQLQDLLLQWLLISLLRSHCLKYFSIYLTSRIPNDSLAQQLSLHYYIFWLLDNGWHNHFIDQVTSVHGLHVHKPLPRINHSLLEARSTGNIPNFPLLRNCSSGDGSL